ncbi:MAG: hypothetical protein PVG25_05310 [Anaerolineae bacterium]|jgi:hypothetical protein
MTAQATLELRKEEFRRRVEALPKEVKQWKQRTEQDLDSNLHFTQLQAIGILVKAFEKQQKALLLKLEPHGDASLFHNVALDLLKSIVRSQHAWDFFRDKLDLRFSPAFKDVLWVADTVAWDCYRPVLDGATSAGILAGSDLREPPLTYLTAELSPATWVRGQRPHDGRNYYLGTASLPIPVINLPWDHVENIWECMSLHHEVGHDLEADLGLREVLAASLRKVLTGNGVPSNRIEQWVGWQGEVFADLVGLQLGGPPWAEALMHLLLLPAAAVTTTQQATDPTGKDYDPHPTPYLRILMLTAYIPTMIADHKPLADDAQQVEDRWIGLYGDQSQFAAWWADFPLVFQALMDTPFEALKEKTVRQLMPYTKADDARIRGAVKYLRTGKNKPAQLRPRHCISAARMAVTEAALEGQLDNDLLNSINERTMKLVRDNAPGGLRGGADTPAHREFIASFVDKF